MSVLSLVRGASIKPVICGAGTKKGLGDKSVETSGRRRSVGLLAEGGNGGGVKGGVNNNRTDASALGYRRTSKRPLVSPAPTNVTLPIACGA